MKYIPVFTILIELQTCTYFKRYSHVTELIFELRKSLENCRAAEAAWLLTEPKTFDTAIAVAKSILELVVNE
jgi:hypothetical protein